VANAVPAGLLLAEGKVTQKADIQPLNSESYMKLKRYVYQSL